ncbi:CDP-glycerol glycerophosphotransferase (TagB/SpsB family) [Cytobacillus purgationiresistens]|uniref:CDP-glycerol glycerophosphotransferase (TagB/SpsB family) n=1 Tax=Cytobacillus purgationiresistens TaxID=863449 RepID=A0ABU0AFA4_9BACI|nr:CDP-glycerol glycerophosphotransferase (TagB/SpsB family) [Cytobacillus purgationiresistens]
MYVYKELRKKEYSGDIVFLNSKGVKFKGSDKENVKIYHFETYHVFDTFFSIYHLATSKHILIDNYYGFLSTVKFKEGVVCTQLWHAAGAIKKFGLLDPSSETRSKRANKRFLKVYNQFDKIVVGSDQLAQIYYEAFAASKERILKTGIPRTDLLYDQAKGEKKMNKIMKKFPALENKKIILYAPTYRESDLHSFELHLDISLMVEHLGEEYVLLLKLHPAVKGQYTLPEHLSDSVIDCSGLFKVNDLLFVSDYLITDYSSIPFEYAILEKPMIFFPYDIESYEKERGFWQDYTEFVPGPVAFHTQEIIDILLNQSFDYEEIRKFKEEWNEYSQGKSSENLVNTLFFNED